MQGAQNKKKTPGAYKSCLIPYQQQIFHWWFDERLTATEIQQRLKAEHDLDIHRTSITRFIKVRREKPDLRKRLPHLQDSFKKSTIVPIKNPVSKQESSTQKKTSKSASKAKKRRPAVSEEDQKIADELIGKITNPSLSQLRREAAEVKKKKTEKQ